MPLDSKPCVMTSSKVAVQAVQTRDLVLKVSLRYAQACATRLLSTLAEPIVLRFSIRYLIRVAACKRTLLPKTDAHPVR